MNVRSGNAVAKRLRKMLAGQRLPRNLLISEVLRDYDYADARGMGIRNKIVPLMRSRNGVAPEFEATEDHVRLTLRRGPGGVDDGRS